MKRVKVVGVIGSQGRSFQNSWQSGSGVGKDTLADCLVSNYEYVHLKFADSLRDLFYEDFKLPENKKRNKVFEFSIPQENQYVANSNSERCFLLNANNFNRLDHSKTINENLINYAAILREDNPNIFVVSMLQKIIKVINSSKEEYIGIVISDMRQFNEYQLLKSLNGTQIEVWRNSALREKQSLDCQLLEFTDCYVQNNDTIEYLSDYIKSDIFLSKEGDFSEINEYRINHLLKGYLNEYPFNSQG